MQVKQGLARYGATITDMGLTVQANSAWHEYHHGAACLFSLMPCLQQLQLMCPGPFLDASRDLPRLDCMPQLRILTLRDLTCSTPWQAGSLSSLGLLKKLQFLSFEIEVFGWDSKVLPSMLTSLTCLTHLDINIWSNDIDDVALGRAVGRLTSLEEVWLGCMHACVPAGLSGLPNLKCAYLGDVDDTSPDEPGHTKFEIGALQACPSLTWLLLASFDGKLDSNVSSLFQCVSALTSLQRLSLQSTDLTIWASLGNGLPSRVVDLALVDCSLTALPPCLVNHQGLNSLDLSSNDITDLPVGPYLKRLRALDISHTNLLQVSAALLEAASLEELVWHDAWDNGVPRPVQLQVPATCSISIVKTSCCWPGALGYPEGMDEWTKLF